MDVTRVQFETSVFYLAIVQSDEQHSLAFKSGCSMIPCTHQILCTRPWRCPQNDATQQTALYHKSLETGHKNPNNISSVYRSPSYHSPALYVSCLENPWDVTLTCIAFCSFAFSVWFIR